MMVMGFKDIGDLTVGILKKILVYNAPPGYNLANSPISKQAIDFISISSLVICLGSWIILTNFSIYSKLLTSKAL